MTDVTNLGPVIDVLADMRSKGIFSDYAIGGAVAGILHNEPFNTIDLDIFFFFVEKQTGLILSLEKIYDYFRDRGFSFDKDFINIHGWPVQFVESSNNKLWAEAVETAGLKTIDSRQIKVIDPEHLAAMWILAGRKKDFYKLDQFDEARIMNAEKLKDILDRFDLLEKWRTRQTDFSPEYRF
ncbi:MAG: hypothetical protein ACRD6X_17305 [Pyrinomonadaceae bacterium]